MEIKSFIMNRLLVSCYFMLISFCAQAQYNDTLFYKSGQQKAVAVRIHDEKFLTYEFRNASGKLIEKRVKLNKLEHFVIYDEAGNLVRHSKQPKRKED